MITGENWAALITVPQYERLQREEQKKPATPYTHTHSHSKYTIYRHKVFTEPEIYKSLQKYQCQCFATTFLAYNIIFKPQLGRVSVLSVLL